MRSGQNRRFEAPYSTGEQAAVAWTPTPERPATPIDEMLERNRPRLLTIEGVIGVGHGRTASGDDAVLIYVTDNSVRDRTPGTVEGYAVDVVVVPGGFDAQ